MKFSKLLFCCYRSENKVPENKVSENKGPSLITWTETIPFKVPITNGYVLKVYDGDTITIASKLPFENSPIYRFSVRLAGIDTPEIKGKTEKEKNMAKDAKNKLETMIMGKQILLKNINTEKYGRILADIYLEDIHINKWMIEQNLAIEYAGGKKTSWN
jgi:endonuclease YncB( thermonuclease family)